MSKRRLSIAVIGVALALCGCTKTPPEAKLVGEWEGTSWQRGSIVFNRDHSVRGMSNDFVLDPSMLWEKWEWRIDASHDPIWLDVVITVTKGPNMGNQQVLPGIVRFVTDQKLIVRTNVQNPLGPRPTGFATTSEQATGQIVLVKMAR